MSMSPAPTEALWKGVDRLLDDYVGVRPGDIALVLYTPDSAEPAIWVSAGLEFRGVPVRRVWMEPLHDAEFPERLGAGLVPADELDGRIVLITLERDTMSHAQVIGEAMSRYSPERRVIVRVISASADLFSGPLRAAPRDLTQRNATLLDHLAEASSLRVETSGGTDLTIGLDRKFRWISNRGVARTGGKIILPAGEVATYPASVEGVFVADFAFNVNAVTDRDARLDSHPVRIEIEAGEAVDWRCENSDVLAFVDECFRKENAKRVGELGFGTNPFVVEPIAHNSHVNERRPGIHLGFGQHNQTKSKVGYYCPLHLDLIARGAAIEVDGVSIDVAKLEPDESIAHPSFPDDQDVFAPDQDVDDGDCCGVLAADGLRPF